MTQDAKNRVQGMVRSMDQWRNMVPVAVAAGSVAQVEYALIDAKHDIEALWCALSALRDGEATDAEQDSEPIGPNYWPSELREFAGRFASLRSALVAAPPAPTAAVDDPELDATDGAHPAWWRGHDHTATVFCKLVNDILDRKPVRGIANEPWESTRTRLAALAPKPAGEGVIAYIRQRDIDGPCNAIPASKTAEPGFDVPLYACPTVSEARVTDALVQALIAARESIITGCDTAHAVAAIDTALKAPAPEAVAPTGTVISDAMVAAFQEKYREVAERYHWGHSWPAQAPSRDLLEAALSAPKGEGEAL
ncbi:MULTISPECIES: hypothetical protein [unclassified Mesorhizobium]|uniref:hypothetical protein n=1 Tax=unclassified Mesorhizobium TaxID=325217 RepID=UPI001125B50C|nr:MULTISPECIES: hypothetical protein [unclassified Mesorhizobium]TPJ86916.1 hypothetical protein FJ489_30650 [Mesorhizobium sp. B2-5-12]TPK19139.1 hypothetical protein FJ562_31055 [Mesorhizobium sp. B2-5-6]